MAKATKSWSNLEMQIFLAILGVEQVQMKLNGALRNRHVYQEVAEKMAVQGFE